MIGVSPDRKVRVLLVEDNPGDVRLIREGLNGSALDVDLHVVEDGDAALAFLERTGGYEQVERPDLIVLDLNLPGRDGRDILHDVKQHPELRTIPLLVLTSSDDPLDIRTAYDRYANAYVQKPMELDRFLEAVHHIERFWLSTAALPT